MVVKTDVAWGKLPPMLCCWAQAGGRLCLLVSCAVAHHNHVHTGPTHCLIWPTCPRPCLQLLPLLPVQPYTGSCSGPAQ